jgi:phospholipase/carboxylesterase
MKSSQSYTGEITKPSDVTLETGSSSPPAFLHRFISADRAEPGPEPALVLLHDSGENESQLLAVVEAASEDGKANVIALRGSFPYEDGFSFLSSPGSPEPDQSIFIERANRISEFLEWAVQEYDIDPAKIVMFGAGDGATLAITLLFVHSEMLGGAVLYRPKSPYRPKPLPALPCYPILLINPKNESKEEKSAAEALAELLFDCGCSVRKVRVPDDHRCEEKSVKAVRAWYKKVAATDISIECAL